MIIYLFLILQFNPEMHPEIMNLIPQEYQDTFTVALQDAGKNWAELAEAIRECKPEYRDACIWLILSMPHLDRLEMTQTCLLEHIEYAYKVKKALQDTLFREYILAYRIDEEPVKPWRKYLSQEFSWLKGKKNSPKELNKWISVNMKTVEPELLGPQASPVETFISKSGTPREIALLTVAICKSIGIPAQQVRCKFLGEEASGKSWLELYERDTWLPLYPTEPEAFGDFNYIEQKRSYNISVAVSKSAFKISNVTPHYTTTGVVEIEFTKDDTLLQQFEHFSLNVLNNGTLRALDDLGYFEPTSSDSQGLWQTAIGNGQYVAVAGVRNSTGSAWVVMKEIEVLADDTTRIQLDLTPKQ